MAKGKRLLFLACATRHVQHRLLARDGAASVGLHDETDMCGGESQEWLEVRLLAACDESACYLRFQRPSHRLKGPTSRSFVAAATLRWGVFDFSRNSK
jgi:hypothetical protein